MALFVSQPIYYSKLNIQHCKSNNTALGTEMAVKTNRQQKNKPVLPSVNNIVTYKPTARQRPVKHIPAGANARNNRTFNARQRIINHAFLTIEAMFNAWL
jgi:hypothetical protein